VAIVDFSQVAAAAFSDMLILRDRVLHERETFRNESANWQELTKLDEPALQDRLMRCEILNRTEALIRTTDLRCHPLEVLKES
jgi:hypothetical protein